MELMQFAQKHAVLISTLAVCVILLIIEEANSFFGAEYELDPEKALVLQHKNATILDIRDKKSFNQAHIDHAENVSAELLKHSPEKVLKRDQNYIIYCEEGSESLELASSLRKKHGYKLYTITGGYNNWCAEGFNSKPSKTTPST